jgi:transposase
MTPCCRISSQGASGSPDHREPPTRPPLHQESIRPRSSTARHWEGLTAFLDYGRLEPDTNTVERSIRPIAIGKKNSLFSGDEGGGETWAILSSLLNTAKLNGLDPEARLTDVLERMVSGRTTNDRLHELLAWNWKPEAAQAKLAA